jgi:CheY-like chemotaxis protein
VTCTTKSLLIVEDNEVTRECLAAILRQQGYSTRDAPGGCEAIALLREEKPDLILLDMLLNGDGDDGWTLLGRMQLNPEWQSIPVVIVTGIPIACHEWAAAMGARGLVRKPIDPDDLFLKIKCHCS